MKYYEARTIARTLRKNQTKAENEFWQRVRNRKFNGLKFNRQILIEYENDSYFIADFYCHQLKLIIEIDGPVHQFQKEYDQMREIIIKELDYKIIRFTNDQVLRQWNVVVNKIQEFTLP
ncbi:unnamed protein product [Symbiodinium microadriaticum]|nr:unnamed protein product [Symbiodinium microadriaticum]